MMAGAGAQPPALSCLVMFRLFGMDLLRRPFPASLGAEFVLVVDSDLVVPAGPLSSQGGQHFVCL